MQLQIMHKVKSQSMKAYINLFLIKTFKGEFFVCALLVLVILAQWHVVTRHSFQPYRNLRGILFSLLRNKKKQQHNVQIYRLQNIYIRNERHKLWLHRICQYFAHVAVNYRRHPNFLPKSIQTRNRVNISVFYIQTKNYMLSFLSKFLDILRAI